MFRLADPYFLLLLAIVPAVLFYRWRRQTLPALKIPDLDTVEPVRPSLILRLRWVMPTLKYAALILMILALARPQWGTRHVNMITEGINILLTLDLSESMAAIDFKRGDQVVNRLEAVKGVVADFIGKREGDRIGVVVFGTEAYTQVPLTRDYSTIATILNQLHIGAAGKKTAIGDAIGISLKRLEDIESTSNVIILLTDGQSNVGQIPPLGAAKIAKDRGIKIYTIGVGTRGRAPYEIRHPILGMRKIFRRVNIDESTLTQIATITGGLYFRAEDTEGLRKIYETIDRLEKTEVEITEFSEYREYYPQLLIPAFLLLIVWAILANTRYLRVP